ncbi:hypothetical protein HY932_01190 [Candidatus Falkowbacteria bacterium]|nr:hypothetical protein [Candidatus Falkowbacteria bacterium]
MLVANLKEKEGTEMARSIVRRCGKCGKWFNASKVAREMFKSAEVQACLIVFGGTVNATAAVCPHCGHENELDPPIKAATIA